MTRFFTGPGRLDATVGTPAHIDSFDAVSEWKVWENRSQPPPGPRRSNGKIKSPSSSSSSPQHPSSHPVSVFSVPVHFYTSLAE